MESEEKLYEEMRATIRADQERVARRRAEQKPSDPTPRPQAEPPSPQRRGGLRRLFGSRRDPA
jgi:hypothetical protein